MKRTAIYTAVNFVENRNPSPELCRVSGCCFDLGSGFQCIRSCHFLLLRVPDPPCQTFHETLLPDLPYPMVSNQRVPQGQRVASKLSPSHGA
jgi:hypothetical protein